MANLAVRLGDGNMVPRPALARLPEKTAKAGAFRVMGDCGQRAPAENVGTTAPNRQFQPIAIMKAGHRLECVNRGNGVFGLAVLFGLALWVAGTVLAMWMGGRIGAWMGEKVGLPLVGGLLGVSLGFMLAMGHVFFEKITVERTVDELCRTRGGIHIYLSPEEHARRMRDNDWEGVKQAEIKDYGGSITLGKVVTLDGKKFYPSNDAIAGKSALIFAGESTRESYPRHVSSSSRLYYDVAHQVPLFHVKSFFVVSGRGGSSPHFKFWIPDNYGCYHAKATFDLINNYQNNMKEKKK